MYDEVECTYVCLTCGLQQEDAVNATQCLADVRNYEAYYELNTAAERIREDFLHGGKEAVTITLTKKEKRLKKARQSFADAGEEFMERVVTRWYPSAAIFNECVLLYRSCAPQVVVSSVTANVLAACAFYVVSCRQGATVKLSELQKAFSLKKRGRRFWRLVPKLETASSALFSRRESVNLDAEAEPSYEDIYSRNRIQLKEWKITHSVFLHLRDGSKTLRGRLPFHTGTLLAGLLYLYVNRHSPPHQRRLWISLRKCAELVCACLTSVHAAVQRIKNLPYQNGRQERYYVAVADLYVRQLFKKCGASQEEQSPTRCRRERR